MEAAEHGIPSSYSCLSQGIVHILICSSTDRIMLSDPFPVQRGQTGMSIVWTAVQSFINDILDGVAPITVPGLPRDTTPSEDSCTQTMCSLLTLSNHCWLRRLLGQWANRWEMQFGVAKCGIISFTGHLAP
ncbi:hypothetical protein BASA83_011599, partial [Batrachochytrium salamandrivorans]